MSAGNQPRFSQRLPIILPPLQPATSDARNPALLDVATRQLHLIRTILSRSARAVNTGPAAGRLSVIRRTSLWQAVSVQL